MAKRKNCTNADQIRSMTDDQLAKALLAANDTGVSIPFCQELPECECLLDDGITRLLDGTEVDLVVTDFDEKTIRLESRDCLGINTSANDLKAYLDRVYALLPEALKKRIVEVERHHLDYKGKKFTDRCKLFVPAASEVFPPEDCYGDKGLYEQMEWYKDVHNRMRADCKWGDSHWYWLSSPHSSNSNLFCIVYSDGNADFNTASSTYGLAPFGCIISKI